MEPFWVTSSLIISFLAYSCAQLEVSVAVVDIESDSATVTWNITWEETVTDRSVQLTEVIVKEINSVDIVDMYRTENGTIREYTVKKILIGRTLYNAYVNVTGNFSDLDTWRLLENSNCEEFTTPANLLWILSIASGAFLVFMLLSLLAIDISMKAKERKNVGANHEPAGKPK